MVTDYKKKNKTRKFILSVEVEEIIDTGDGVAGFDILHIKKPVSCKNYKKRFVKIIHDFETEMTEYLGED